MAQTYTNWQQVPASIEAKIRKFWHGTNTATYDQSHDHNGDKITVYKLANYKVRENADYLTDAQKIKIFDIVSNKDLVLSSMLDRLDFEIETIRVHDEIYHLPANVIGTWPHCNMFGCMDESGYVHT
jgi:hypothetical protein